MPQEECSVPAGSRLINRPVRAVLIAVVIIVLIGLRFTETIGPDLRPGERFVVARIIDGDTFELAGGDRVRLLGIDAPERDEPLHAEAAARLAELTLGRQVSLTFGSRRRDRYGRLLAFVWADTVPVNRRMVADGLAYLYLFADDPIGGGDLETMLAAQRVAIDSGFGIMGLEREAEPYYLAAPSSYRFHRPSCGSLRRYDTERWRRFVDRFVPLRDGLSPCRQCRP